MNIHIQIIYSAILKRKYEVINTWMIGNRLEVAIEDYGTFVLMPGDSDWKWRGVGAWRRK